MGGGACDPLVVGAFASLTLASPFAEAAALIAELFEGAAGAAGVVAAVVDDESFVKSLLTFVAAFAAGASEGVAFEVADGVEGVFDSFVDFNLLAGFSEPLSGLLASLVALFPTRADERAPDDLLSTLSDLRSPRSDRSERTLLSAPLRPPLGFDDL